MKKYLVVQADTNDGDYVMRKEIITDEQLEAIRPVIEAIKNFKKYRTKFVPSWDKTGREMEVTHGNNYPIGECLRANEGQKSVEEMYGHLEGFDTWSENYVPYSEYGIHTIQRVELLEVANETRLL